MNKKIDSSFDRVEKALGTLIDSIAKYNPSTSQVEELGNADAELTKGLKDLQTHQFNYQRILDLRSETAKYDAQIKDTLRLLANTRKELVHASATAFPDGPNYKIQYDELLSYAGRISRTTIPPVGAVNAIPAGTTESSQLLKGEASAPETAATTPAAETPNGVATPQPTQPLSVTANGDGGGGITDSQLSNATTANTAGTGSGTELPEGLATFLNPHSAYTFVPWPTEEQVRHGAVAALAYLAEQGIEAEGYDPAAEKAREEREAEERRAAEERERADREERERRLREEHARARDREDKERAEAWRRASVSAGAAAAATVGSGAPAVPPQPQPKAQFQFMGDDDDDDDD